MPFSHLESPTLVILCAITISDPNVRFGYIVKNITNNNSVICVQVLGRLTGSFCDCLTPMAALLFRNVVSHGIKNRAHIGPKNGLLLSTMNIAQQQRCRPSLNVILN